jgi:hypothetical protein
LDICRVNPRQKYSIQAAVPALSETCLQHIDNGKKTSEILCGPPNSSGQRSNTNFPLGHHVREKKSHQIANIAIFHYRMALELQNIGPPDLSSVWTMYFEGSKRVAGAGAGVVLISPQGDKLKYVVQMSFPHASNNKAEYQALLHCKRIAKAYGATRLKIFGISNLVIQQVMNHCDVVSDNMTT